MDKKNILKEGIVLFWLFVIASFLGCIFEILVLFFRKGYFETRQGLVYGPFIQVYGIGAILYYIVLNKIHNKSTFKVFIITAIIGGITEYIFSFLQEKIFGTISWDYSYLPFNINGRTSLLHCSYWGIGGIIFIKLLIPILEKLKEKIDNKFIKIFTIVFAIFIFLDIIISYMAGIRETERRNNIEAKNGIDIFIDKNYSDEFMEKIYNNRKLLQAKEN